MPETLPVLVVGAGPTGLTAAMELSRMGVPVRLVDKALEPSTTSRALAVQARTLELMQQRGLSEELLAAGNRGKAATIYSKGKQLGRVELGRIRSPFNFVLMIPQSETERILREQLQRQLVVVEFGTEMIGFTQSNEREQDGSVRTVLRKQDGSLEEVEAAYMIAAEGAHSNVRDTLGLAFAGKSLPHSYALGDLHLDGEIPDDEISIFLPETGLMAVFPLGNRRFRMIATDTEDSAKSTAEPTLAHMQELWDAKSAIPARLRDMYWSSHFRINSRMLEQLRQNRIFFAGDSAHIHSPAGGQGMNTGIQDMMNLGWKLAMVYQGVAAPSLLDTFEAERLPVIRALVETTEGATDALTADSAFMHNLIKLAAPVALGLGQVQDRAAKMLSQTGTSYPDSPLTKRGGSLGELHAGERVVPAADQTPLSPDRFSLLVAEGLPTLPSVLEPWRDMVDVRTGVLADRSPAMCALVRPDGYIAVITKQAEDLRTWFQTWMPVPQR